MPVIGQFMRENDGFIGHLTTLSLHQDIIIVAAEPSDAENAPDYRVHVLDTISNETGAEIGAVHDRLGDRLVHPVQQRLLLDPHPSGPVPVGRHIGRGVAHRLSPVLHGS